MIHIVPKGIRRRVRQHRPVMWAINSVLILLFTFVLLAISHKFIEETSWEIAFWMSWETFSTVGYGDHPAKTTFGRTTTMIIGTLIIIIMSAVAGIVVALIDYTLTRRRKGLMNNPFTNGYVIMHYPGTQQVATFIREIRAREPEVGVCIMDSALEELPQEIQNMDKVHFVRGSMLRPEVYEKARLKENKVVIVFPKKTGDTESDGITKVVVDLVLKHVGSETRVMYVLVDEHNGHMFQDLPASRVLEYLEVLSLVQECQDNHSAKIIEQLLRNTEGADPSTVVPVLIVGWTWKKFACACPSVEGARVNPLALVRNGKVHLCPDPNEIIQNEDRLSVITFQGLDWETFESELVKVANCEQ